MFNLIQGIGIVILIILFMIILLILNTRNNESTLLSGFWRANAEFCKEAQIDIFLIYIGDSSLFSNTYPGYILVKNDQGIIINDPIKINFSSDMDFSPSLCDCRNYIIKIDWEDNEEGYEFFPSEQEVFYYPKIGKLVFSAHDQVFAILYKDNSISDINNVLPDNVIGDSDNGSDSIVINNSENNTQQNNVQIK